LPCAKLRRGSRHDGGQTVEKYLVSEAGAAVKLHKYDEQQGNQYLFLLDPIVY
jgi:hypothetical protein